MKDPSDSPSPRRLAGLLLLGCAALAIYLTGTAPAAVAIRRPLLLGLGALFLLGHAWLAPGELCHELVLILRRRERACLDPGDGPSPFHKLRCVDLAAALLLSLTLFTGLWLVVEGTAPRDPGSWQTGAGTMAGLLLLALAALTGFNRSAVRAGPEAPASLAALRLAPSASLLLRPLFLPAAAAARRFVWLDLPPQQLEREAADAAEDLADVIETESHQGDLTIVQTELLRRELDFVRKTAAEVMVPRIDADYLDVAMTFAAARQHVIDSPHSRYPVQRGSVDNIVAVLHVKELLRFSDGDEPESLHKLLVLLRSRPPLHVAAAEPLDSVLETMKREHVWMAVVDDEYGGVAGILTIEDIVEELVGEIVDESDSEPVAETLLCSGRRLLAELAEQGIELPGEPETTLADFLAARLPDEPRPGLAWTAPGLRLVVEATDSDGGIESVRAERQWAAVEQL